MNDSSEFWKDSNCLGYKEGHFEIYVQQAR